MWVFEVWIPNWFLAILCSIILIYIHYVKSFTFWKSQGVNGPTPWPLFGNWNSFLSPKPVHDTEFERFKKFGNIYGRYEFGTKVLSVNDPDLLKLIFVKNFNVFRNRRTFGLENDIFGKTIMFSEDEEWKDLRKILSPTFSSGKLKQMSGLMLQCCDELGESLTKYSNTMETQDFKSVFFSFAVNVVAKCFFGVDFDGSDPNGQFHINTKKILKVELSIKTFLWLLFPKLMGYFTTSIFDTNAIAYYSKVITKIIEARKGSKSNRVDFLQIIMDCMPDEGTKLTEKTAGSKRKLTLKEIVLESIIFILAGVETTSLALSFVAYNLALNPDCQERLQQEIDNVIEQSGEVSYDTVQNMPYLKAVVDETLRLFPPGSKGERICSQNYCLDEIFVPKGTSIHYSIYCMHRNPEYWPNPNVFDPERFLGENVENQRPYAYMPFAYGPRNCIAQRFSLLEIKLCTARMLKKWSFVKCSQTKVPLKFKSGLDLMMPESVDLQIRRREAV